MQLNETTRSPEFGSMPIFCKEKFEGISPFLLVFILYWIYILFLI